MVRTDVPSRSAISLLDDPAATISAISRCRGVSGSGDAGLRVAGVQSPPQSLANCADTDAAYNPRLRDCAPANATAA
jgi:hypothetical protein